MGIARGAAVSYLRTTPPTKERHSMRRTILSFLAASAAVAVVVACSG